MNFRKQQMNKMRRQLIADVVFVVILVTAALAIVGIGALIGYRDIPAADVSQDVESDEPPPEAAALVEECEPAYTVDELFCIAATIYNEAGADACSDETRRLVGYVVLNRVNHPAFPNTIREVLEQKNQYGRFYYTGVKFADRASLPQEQHAVNRAYDIARQVLETEVIPIPSTVVFQSEFKQGPVYKYIDGIYFCHTKEVK